jgi:cullin-associated NEDD8-dissociated protein 1
MAEVFELIKQSNGSQVIKALAGFFGVYVANEEDSALRLVPSLVNNLGKATALPDATHGGTAPYTTTARCIGAVMFNSQRNLAGILSTFQHDIQSGKAPEPTVYLALLCIGEIGRLDNLSVNADLFQQVLAFLDHGNDEVSSAAAFAAGNMVVGAPEELLPVLIRRLESAKSDSAHLLLLHALKEVIMHSSDPLLDKLTDLLWRPLFSMDASADDGVRNVKAACIGKLTIASPGRFLPQLQSMLRGSVQERALVAAAIRYAFIDSDKDYAARTDELLAPIVGEFLALMNDENHVIRRLAVAALNAAAQNRPYLIADKLSTLQQYLYKETEIKKELQREVPMGPFKGKHTKQIRWCIYSS